MNMQETAAFTTIRRGIMHACNGLDTLAEVHPDVRAECDAIMLWMDTLAEQVARLQKKMEKP
jgi:hypothetical protein